jgi:hypothetical protein
MQTRWDAMTTGLLLSLGESDGVLTEVVRGVVLSEEGVTDDLRRGSEMKQGKDVNEVCKWKMM